MHGVNKLNSCWKTQNENVIVVARAVQCEPTGSLVLVIRIFNQGGKQMSFKNFDLTPDPNVLIALTSPVNT